MQPPLGYWQLLNAMPAIEYPSSGEIRDAVLYVDGCLFWKQASGRGRTDRPIGSKTRNGYLLVNWPCQGKRRKLLVHRLVWLYFNDTLPPLLDHINRIKEDNRIENLRPLSFSENARNCGDKHYKNKLPRGVTMQRGKYKAQIKLQGKTTHIGIYASAEQASRGYRAFVAKLKADGHIEGQPGSHE